MAEARLPPSGRTYKTTALKEPTKDQSFVEQEQAIIEGIDVSGQWNRMYVPREITDYDLTFLDKLTDLDGGESMGWCYQCAQCVPACPVDTAGGDYAPRKIFRRLQTGTDIFNHRDLWLCTTCQNCLRVCPKEVDMIQIMPAARAVAVLEGNIPDELQEMFQNVAEYGNPMGQSPRKRAKWVRKADAEIRVLPKEKEPSPVEVLWFVGDYYAYHGRGVDAANAMARVFNRLGVDFGILGADERCDGDSQRLAGEPGLFEEVAEHNIAQFNKYQFDKIVVSGPHAYNAIKNEYPKMGGGSSDNTFAVEHYTQYLNNRLDELTPLLKKPFPKRVTFHDPCYLGRHNGEYDAPRALLQAVPEIRFTEMFRCKAQGYCCGGGGGGMWLDGNAALHQAERLSENRVKEAVEVGAEVLAVCCPYEVSRFEDAVKSTDNDGKLEVLDIIEILDRCME